MDVHDGSGDLPVLDTGLIDEAPAEAETGRGLLLVTSLSAEWGFYRTPPGKAVYFTLELQRDIPETGIDAGERPSGRTYVKIGQLTDVSHCNLHDCFPCKDAVAERRDSAPCSAPSPGADQTRPSSSTNVRKRTCDGHDSAGHPGPADRTAASPRPA